MTDVPLPSQSMDSQCPSECQSPIPLTQSELESEEVRRLASRLAPALEAADDVLTKAALDVLSGTDGHAQQPRHNNNVDVDVDDVVDVVDNSDDSDDMDQELSHLRESEDMLREELNQDFSALFPVTPTHPAHVGVPSPYQPPLLEADGSNIAVETPEQDLPPIRLSDCLDATTSTRTTATATSHRTHQSRGHPEVDLAQQAPVVLVAYPSTHPYTQHDHSTHLGIILQQGYHLVNHQTYTNSQDVQEYCAALGDAELKASYLIHKQSNATSRPCRTVRMRLRPDVLCGAVMDAVVGHFTILRKRQGNHMQGVLELAQEEDTQLTIFCDAQVTVYKTRECQRYLLLRFYHASADAEYHPGESKAQDQVPTVTDDTLGISISTTDALDTMSLRLKECCTLIQRMQTPDFGKRNQNVKSQQPLADASDIVRQNLLENYKACPSVKDGNVTLPALNSDDWKIIEGSWSCLHAIHGELESRELLYSCLSTCRFGVFPALPSLDAHYCSQMRRLSREFMIVELLRSATDLEEYARQSELSCANLIHLLQPTFETYGVDAPPLPKPKSLTEYPLHFTAPQSECPPWGLKVMEALNEVQKWSGEYSSPTSPATLESKESFSLAERAIELVLGAFQKQDDEEQSARLERKNVQVMDRLAKMRSHQKTTIDMLASCIDSSTKAQKAATDLEERAGIFEVPLLKWSIVVGGSTGTCTVTSRHLVFETRKIPLIGGNTTRVFDMKKVHFSSTEASPSILNPLPTVITITNGADNFSFRPSSGGSRLKNCLDVVREAALDVTDG